MKTGPWLALALAALPFRAGAEGGSIVSSKHNLSFTGPGAVRAVRESEICIFCHVGHGDDKAGQNRPDPKANYVPYSSTTMASPSSTGPTGATRICLSCHDGTIAVGQTLSSGTFEMSAVSADGRLTGPSSIGTDLRSTHPVSLRPTMSNRVRPPEPGSSVRLDRDGLLQCTSCHDPHREDIDPVQKNFLTKQNRGSALCLTCHVFEYWATNPSAHQSSLAPFDRTRGADTGYTTVSENGCESCHRSHGADEQGRLLRRHDRQDQSQICLACHDGTVAKIDLRRDLEKQFAHGTTQPQLTSAHDASEGPQSVRFQLPEVRASAPRHATCVDCHNPHAAMSRDAMAPFTPGALAGVWGIDRNGLRVDAVRFEYEVCFKCHGDSANQPQARGPIPPSTLRRANVEVNLRKLFADNAASFHPVVSPGRNPDVPSLLAPLMPSSQIYCSDCHSSDTGPGAGAAAAAGSARGPHGSNFRPLLERNLTTSDRTPESPFAYALCYKCHDREVVLSDRSAFREHRRHVVESATPCTACHASHGVSATQGSPQGNAHLIDFDISIVGPGDRGVREYTTLGPRSGTCTAACHGARHEQTKY